MGALALSARRERANLHVWHFYQEDLSVEQKMGHPQGGLGLWLQMRQD